MGDSDPLIQSGSGHEAKVSQPAEPDKFSSASAKTHIVILIHGIRDYALWQNSIRSTLEEAGLVVEPTNYNLVNAFGKNSTLAQTSKINFIFKIERTCSQTLGDSASLEAGITLPSEKGNPVFTAEL